MRLKINPLVALDLKNIKSFIAEDNTKMAEKTIQEILKNFELLQRFPYAGNDLKKRVKFHTEYKYISKKNYIIIYKIQKESVEIYRVLNRFQDITLLFQ